MCIICNCHESIEDASQFLSAYGTSQFHMKKSAKLMKKCSKVVDVPKIAKQYDKTHKRMVKLIREWNKLERLREEATEGCS